MPVEVMAKVYVILDHPSYIYFFPFANTMNNIYIECVYSLVIRTASLSKHYLCLELNKKTIRIFHLKIVIFTLSQKTWRALFQS